MRMVTLVLNSGSRFSFDAELVSDVSVGMSPLDVPADATTETIGQVTLKTRWYCELALGKVGRVRRFELDSMDGAQSMHDQILGLLE